MRYLRTRMLPALASALLLAPLLTSCAAVSRPVSPGSKPAEARVAPVWAPRIPNATTPCPDDATAKCNTDLELAQIMADYDDALAEANRRICYLRVWLGFSACPLGDP